MRKSREKIVVFSHPIYSEMAALTRDLAVFGGPNIFKENTQFFYDPLLFISSEMVKLRIRHSKIRHIQESTYTRFDRYC